MADISLNDVILHNIQNKPNTSRKISLDTYKKYDYPSFSK